MDILFLGLAALFVAAMAALVIGCDALRRPPGKAS
jgi:hypothetical protein